MPVFQLRLGEQPLARSAPELGLWLHGCHSLPDWQFGPVIGLDGEDVRRRQRPDGLLVAADVLGDPGEGVAEALLFDVVGAALSHAHGLLDGPQRLEERFPAVSAAEALYARQEPHGMASNRAVAVGRLLRAVLVQPTDRAALGAGAGQEPVFGLQLVFVPDRSFGKKGPVGEVEDVRHLAGGTCVNGSGHSLGYGHPAIQMRPRCGQMNPCSTTTKPLSEPIA